MSDERIGRLVGQMELIIPLVQNIETRTRVLETPEALEAFTPSELDE